MDSGCKGISVLVWHPSSGQPWVPMTLLCPLWDTTNLQWWVFGVLGSLKPKCLLVAVASVSQADSLTGAELHDDWVLGLVPCEAVSKRTHLLPLWWVRGSVNKTFNSSKYVKNRGTDRNAPTAHDICLPQLSVVTCGVSEPALVCCFQCCLLWVLGMVPGA